MPVHPIGGGGSGGGIETINGNNNPNQSFAGSGGTDVSSTGGVTTIHSIPGGSGTVTEVESVNTDIEVTNQTTTPLLKLNSGTGINQIPKLGSTLQNGFAPVSAAVYIGLSQMLDPTISTPTAASLDTVGAKLLSVVKSAGLPGAPVYVEINTDYQIPSPIPAVILVNADSPGLKVILPVMNTNPPPLGVGQSFEIYDADFSVPSFVLCYQDGTPVEMINPLNSRRLYVQSNSTANGVFSIFPETSLILSEQGRDLSGTPILEPDDLYANPANTNQFLPPTASSISGQIVQSNGPGQPTSWANPTVLGTEPLQAVWNWTTTPGLTLIYNNGINGVGATLTNSVNGVLPEIDQMTLAIGSRLALLNYPLASQRGLYQVTDPGSSTTPFVITRTTDFDTVEKMKPGIIFVVNNSATRSGPGLFTGSLVSLAFTVSQVGVSAIYFNVNNAFGTNPTNYVVSPFLDNKYLSPNQNVANLADGSVSNTEFQYLDGATSNIQAQINSKMNAGVVPISLGGTGQTTQQLALNALAGAVTAGLFLRGNGNNILLSAIQASDLPASLNPATVVPISQGGTGQITAQAAINALFGTLAKGAVIIFDGTNVTALNPGTSGDVLTSNGSGNNPSYQGTTNNITYFNWIPVDANALVGFLSAEGTGCLIGRKVFLRFSVLYSGHAPSPDYNAQINGWDTSLNMGAQFITGIARPTSATSVTNTLPNQLTGGSNRVNLAFNGVITQISQVVNTQVTGQIEYVIPASALAAFREAIENGEVNLLTEGEYLRVTDEQ